MVRDPQRGARLSGSIGPARPLLFALVLVALVVGCGVIAHSGGTAARPSGSAAQPGAAPVADSARLSPEAYQRRLGAANTSLTAAWRSVASAGPYDAVGTAAADAGTAASRAADQLAALAPPAGADALNGDLVAGLRQVATDLSGLTDQVSASTLCASPAVVSGLSTAPGTTRLRDVAARLRGAGFQWGDFLGRPIPASDTRLANGAVVNAHRRGGLGELTVDNGNELDAVVTLAQAGAPAVSMYVRHGAKATLNRIPDGSYQVFFTVGADWNGEDRLFTRSCGFSKFDDLASYATTQDGGRTRYVTYDVTLQPVFGGTAVIRQVGAANYPR